MDYFRIEDDLQFPGRWFLGEAFIYGWQFIEGIPKKLEDIISVPVSKMGAELDFTYAALDMPVVKRELGELLQVAAAGSTQMFPVEVDNSSGRYSILNVVARAECVDVGQSEGVMCWSQEDGQADKIGQFRMIGKLRIDPRRVEGHELFRVKGWEVALVCSARIKQLLMERKTTGVRFRKV